jgi:hypothetical protein
MNIFAVICGRGYGEGLEIPEMERGRACSYLFNSNPDKPEPKMIFTFW